jgi:hypothetical protein
MVAVLNGLRCRWTRERYHAAHAAAAPRGWPKGHREAADVDFNFPGKRNDHDWDRAAGTSG